MAFRIRSADRRDIPALLDLWDALMACGTAADPRFRKAPDAREPMRAFMHGCFDAGQPFPPFLVAEVDSDDGPEIVGFVRGFPPAFIEVLDRPPSVRIGDLYVRDAYRRGGIARALVERMLERAAEKGYPRAEVGTLTKDARAVAFWRSMGFGDWQVTLSREG
jgi:GNAT superfamily N-acetyltransferase